MVDGPIITARCPDDLPSFCKAVLELAGKGKPQGAVGKPIAPAWVKPLVAERAA